MEESYNQIYIIKGQWQSGGPSSQPVSARSHFKQIYPNFNNTATNNHNNNTKCVYISMHSYRPLDGLSLYYYYLWFMHNFICTNSWTIIKTLLIVIDVYFTYYFWYNHNSYTCFVSLNSLCLLSNQLSTSILFSSHHIFTCTNTTTSHYKTKETYTSA